VDNQCAKQEQVLLARMEGQVASADLDTFKAEAAASVAAWPGAG
jgi:hypothetical protein